MELQEIITALDGNADLLTGLTTHVLGTDKGKEVITNKANSIFDTRISDEISGVHTQYDADMFEILGEKPKALDGGLKQKTYDKIKELYVELKDLRGKKDSLSKDAEVVKLQQQIEDLKKNGGGAHWEQTFNTEKQKWIDERTKLVEQLEASQGSILDFHKQVDVEGGLRGLKFDEKTPEAARKALVNAVMADMLKNSKKEGDKIMYLDKDGNVIQNSEYAPESASNILKARLKDVLLNENADKGGGADPVIKGSIEITQVDGNDKKTLKLADGSFKTKSEFLQVAEEALLKSGITREMSDWDKLKNEAYSRYNVKELPRV